MEHWVVTRIGEMSKLSNIFNYSGYSTRLANRTQRFWDKLLAEL